MDSSGKKLLFKNEVYQIVACAIEVLNTLGHGMRWSWNFEYGKFHFGSSLFSMCCTRGTKLVCLSPT